MQCFNCGKRLKAARAIYFEGDENMPVCSACYYEISGQALRDYPAQKNREKESGNDNAQRLL